MINEIISTYIRQELSIFNLWEKRIATELRRTYFKDSQPNETLRPCMTTTLKQEER
jgi:hypothetical protein